MRSPITTKPSLLAITIGLLLSGQQTVMAQEYGALVGDKAGITLNDGDKVSIVTDLAANKTAQDNTAIYIYQQNDKIAAPLQIKGAATVEVSSSRPADSTEKLGKNTNAIFLLNGQRNDLGSGTQIIMNTKGEASTGISVNNKYQATPEQYTHLSADQLNINITNNNPNTNYDKTSAYNKEQSVGINFNSQGDLALGNQSQIKINATNSRAVGLINRGNGTANELKMDITGSIGAGIQSTHNTDLGSNSSINLNLTDAHDGRLSYAALEVSYTKKKDVDSASIFKADHLTITANNASGLTVAYSTSNPSNPSNPEPLGHAEIDLGSGSNIDVTDGRYGVVIEGKGTTFKADNFTVTTKNDRFNYKTAAFWAINDSQADIGAASHLSSSNYFALLATNNSSINYLGTADGHNTITAAGDGSGVAVGSNSQINLDYTDITLNANAQRSEGLGLESTAGLFAMGGGQINAANTTITTTGQARAVAVALKSKVLLSGQTKIDVAPSQNQDDSPNTALYVSDNGQIELNGQAEITGDIITQGRGGLINLDLAKDSNLTAAVNMLTTDGTATDTDIASVNIAMQDSTWHMTNNSTLTSLSLNNAKVEFSNPEFSQLTVKTLQGNGQFDLKTDIVGQQGDLIEIIDKAEGEHVLNIANNGAAQTNGKERLTVVKSGDNQANFSLSNQVELGAYLYDLQAVAGSANELELYASSRISTSANAAGNFMNIGYLTNYLENQTLLQRLGDLRNNPGNSSGVWLKGFGGKLSSFSDELFNGFDMSYSGMQLGADTELASNSGTWLVGMMAGYTHTNPHYTDGSGSGKNYSLGYYTTYLADNGFYVDSTLKFNQMRNRFSVLDSAGDNVSGTGKTSGVALSAEVGKRFWFNEMRNGLYLEPQAQLTYGYQTGDNVTASNGLTVNMSHYNSALGRISAIAGYQLSGINPVNLYAKIGVVREFAGKASISFNDATTESYRFRSNWFDTGVGVNVNFAKSHNIYAEFDYANGQKFDKKHVDLGYRYSF